LLVDAHAHLDERGLEDFVAVLSSSGPDISIISNSVNLESSRRNLELSELSQKIIPFVGIHPEVFRPDSNKKEVPPNILDQMVDGIPDIAGRSCGIGEIGLDPKYGSDKEQEKLFRKMLAISEKTGLPTSIHNRSSVSRILEIISTFALKRSVLLHWFAGTEQELAKIGDKEMFVSYGPSILTSKRMRGLVEKTPLDLLLPETDSPTPFASLNTSLSTPFLIASVVFEMGLIMKIPFQDLTEKIESNLSKYLGTQNSLRVKRK
jgi:TatD DNase family protein